MRKKEKSRGKRKLTGIILSVLFTLIVPIGFVFLMGLLSESFPVLYFYTKQIFLAFVALVIAGICMIIYQIVRYVKGDKTDPKEEERKARRERREQRRANAEGTMKHGGVSEYSGKLLYIQEIVFLYDRRYEDITSHIYAHMRKRSTDRKRDRNSGDEDGKADPAWEKDVVV